MSNETLPFRIAPPPMIGPLPAAIVCYILYGLAALLPVALIVSVAVVLTCRRQQRKDGVDSSETDTHRVPEIQKTEPSGLGLHSDTVADTARSSDNPNVYFRQQNATTIHVKSSATSSLSIDNGEFTSGSTVSGRISRQSSSGSRSTLQIRKDDERFPVGHVNAAFDDARQQKVESRDTGHMTLRPVVMAAWQETKNDVGVERPNELLECDQEQALRYFDEVNDDLEHNLDDLDDVSVALYRPTETTDQHNNTAADLVTHL